MKKKGFTLIELLAVIVILAIIVLIITPVITGVIKKAKDAADLRSAEGYIKAGEDYFASTTINNKELDTNVIDDLELSSRQAQEGSSIIVHSNGTIEMAIMINDKCYKKAANETIKDITISTDLNNCYINKTLYATVIAAFPELEVLTDGCKVLDSTKNYSYMGGCYIKGNSNKNYLWYSGYLWRIMGINQDNSVKMITEENIYDKAVTNINSDSDFSFSFSNDVSLLDEKWCNDPISLSTTSVNICSNASSAQYGLISLNEYNLAGGSESYLYSGFRFVTSTPSNATATFVVADISDQNNELVSSIIEGKMTDKYGIRATINVDGSTIVYGGTGTYNTTSRISNPYIISSSKVNQLVDVKNGEYVDLGGQVFRVVNINTNDVDLIYDGFCTVNGDVNGSTITLTAEGYTSKCIQYESYYGSIQIPYFYTDKMNDILKNIISSLLDDKYQSLTDGDARLPYVDERLSTPSSSIFNDYTQTNESNTHHTYKAPYLYFSNINRKPTYLLYKSINDTTLVNMYHWGDSVYTDNYSSISNKNYSKQYAINLSLNSTTMGEANNNTSASVRPIISVKNTQIASGTGTPGNPYQI